MGGLDILIFTGGIGENASYIRAGVLENMEYLGIEFDDLINDAVHGIEKVISKEDSKVKVLVVPTNEELVIAKDTRMIVTELSNR